MRMYALLQNIKNSKFGRLIGRRGFTAAASIVVFITTYVLILPALTETTQIYCGIEEHVHTDECYDMIEICLCQQEERAAHTHTEDCYQDVKYLFCSESDGEGHTHTEECMEEVPILACDEEHEHTDECYDYDIVYTCGKEESQGGHVHTDLCYVTERELICDETEGSGHKHTDECFTRLQGEILCDKPEHTHGPACYSDATADIEDKDAWEKTMKDVKLTGNWAKDILLVADTQLGYQESQKNYKVDEEGNRDGYTRYGQWYGNPYGDWCAMFASFCIYYADMDLKLMPIDSNCENWIKELTKKDLYVEAKDHSPKPGELIFFDFDEDQKADHVGIVEELFQKDGKTHVKTIEGNASDSVKKETYKLSSTKILGYAAIPENPEEKQPETEAVSEKATEKATEIVAETEEVTEEATEIVTEAEETETEVLAETETETEEVTEAVSEVITEPETEPETVIESESAPESEPETVIESESAPESEPETVIESESVPESEPETVIESESASEPESETAIESESESEPESESESGTETESEKPAETEAIYEVSGNTLTAFGPDYRITVTYTEEAGLPADTELMAMEVLGENKEALKDAAIAALGMNPEELAEMTEEDFEYLSFARFFDLKFTSKVLIEVEAEAEEPETMAEDAREIAETAEIQAEEQPTEPVYATMIKEVVPEGPVTVEIAYDMATEGLETQVAKAIIFTEGDVLVQDAGLARQPERLIYHFTAQEVAKVGTVLMNQPVEEETEAETEEEEDKLTQTVEGDDYIITVAYTEEAELPIGAKLTVEEITDEEEFSKVDAYLPQYYNFGVKRIFDMQFMADDVIHEPAVPVDVRITLKQAEEAEEDITLTNDEKATILLMKEDIEELQPEVKEKDEGTQYSYTYEALGEVALVTGEEVNVYTLSCEGEDYKIIVTYTDEAMFPEDVELEVSEILGLEYEENKDELCSAIDSPVQYARFFDITFKSEGEEIEPAVQVNVQILTSDLKKPQEIVGNTNSGVIHFGDEGTELIVPVAEVTEEGDVSLEFNSDSFSTYGFYITGKIEDSNKPGTITTVDTNAMGITMRLFDYYGEEQIKDGFSFDVIDEVYTNTSSQKRDHSSDYDSWDSKSETFKCFDGIRLVGINSVHPDNDFYFTASGPDWNNGNGGTSVNSFTGNTYSDSKGKTGPARLGIINNTLTNGYPTLSNGKGSLDYVFKPGSGTGKDEFPTTVNHLFKEKPIQYDDGRIGYDGTILYDSDQNYAVIRDNGNFDVYETTYDNNNNSKIGFFPFNEYNTNYRELEPKNWRYSEYSTKNNSWTAKNRTQYPYYNHQFGLTLQGKFLLTEGGMVDVRTKEGEVIGQAPMKFEFSGDDDFWLFIDDVLVLDIGGIHQPSTGYIDFSTGVISYEETIPTNGNQSNNQPLTTSLGKVFAEAGRAWNDAVDSVHDVKIFYLERGGCYSNLRMEMNLPFGSNVGIQKKWEDLDGNPMIGTQSVKVNLIRKFEEPDEHNHRVIFNVVGDGGVAADKVNKTGVSVPIDSVVVQDDGSVKFTADCTGCAEYALSKINISPSGKAQIAKADTNSYVISHITDDVVVTIHDGWPDHLPGDNNWFKLEIGDYDHALYSPKEQELVKQVELGPNTGYYDFNQNLPVIVNGYRCIYSIEEDAGSVPNGYEVIYERNDAAAGELIVKNKRKDLFELPHTGGSGTTPYTMGGIACICAAFVLYIFNLRRRQERRLR